LYHFDELDVLVREAKLVGEFVLESLVETILQHDDLGSVGPLVGFGFVEESFKFGKKGREWSIALLEVLELVGGYLSLVGVIVNAD
jgi:hypothetical protein